MMTNQYEMYYSKGMAVVMMLSSFFTGLIPLFGLLIPSKSMRLIDVFVLGFLGIVAIVGIVISILMFIIRKPVLVISSSGISIEQYLAIFSHARTWSINWGEISKIEQINVKAKHAKVSVIKIFLHNGETREIPTFLLKGGKKKTLEKIKEYWD